MRATVIYPIKHNQILLAKKMKKIGAGKWNGFGGKEKIEDISIRHTACRELFEESGFGLKTNPESLIPKAIIKFYLFGNVSKNPDWSVIFYLTYDFTGEIKDTDEMQNATWFNFDNIPYENMLPADQEFLSKILHEDSFTGNVYFDKDMQKVLKSEYKETPLTI